MKFLVDISNVCPLASRAVVVAEVGGLKPMSVRWVDINKAPPNLSGAQVAAGRWSVCSAHQRCSNARVRQRRRRGHDVSGYQSKTSAR